MKHIKLRYKSAISGKSISYRYVISNTTGSTKKVTYAMVDSYHNLCVDKWEIIFEEINACERLLKYATNYNIDDEIDKKYIECEIAYLKMILDLIPSYIHIIL